MAQQQRPPFRADHVGSFLRTAPLKEARSKREKGTITAAELKTIEDREIEKVISKQEEVGLKLATDGEFRRAWWHFDFFDGLDGVERNDEGSGIQFQGVLTKTRTVRVTGKIGFSQHPMIEHFKFLKAHTQSDAENDHPVAERDAFPARTGRREQGCLRRAATRFSTILPPPIRRRCALSTTPAAAICSSTTPPGPISARRRS